MPEKYYLNSTKLLTQKSILLKSSIFLIGLFIILVQNWIDPILILYPIVSFSFSFFFQILKSNKKITELKNSIVVYNPFGDEGNDSNILSIFSYLLLLLVFIMGLDSLLHPQLIDNFFLFFLTPISFFYGFGFFLLIIRVLNNAKIDIKLIDTIDQKEKRLYQNNNKWKSEGTISFLSIKRFKKYSLYNLILFLIILTFTLPISYLTFFGQILGLTFYLPGTGIEGSLPVNISWGLYIGIIVPPFYTIWVLYQIYKKIINFSYDSAEKVINRVTNNSKKVVLLNFLNFNKNN